MGTPLYESLNGRRVPAGTPLFTAQNRAFRFGDGIFETIRLHHGRPLFLDDHMRRLKAGMDAFGFELDTAPIWNELEALSLVNQAPSGRARLTVFREDGGYYAPQNSQASWHLTLAPFSGDFGSSRPNGLIAELFYRSSKPVDVYSNLKTCNALLYVMAGYEANRSGVDEMAIRNSAGRVCEFISGNLFLVKNNMIRTPPLSEGCIDGVMRRQVMALLREMNMAIIEQKLQQEDLAAADELWCTNVIRGVEWIAKLGHAGYNNAVARQVNRRLSEKWLR